MEGILALIPHAPAATLLLAITLATSLYDFLIDGSIRARFILHPYTVVRERQWYRLFTSTLLHGDWLHLFLNLFVYYNFAFYLEAVFYRYYTLGQPALVSSLYFTVIYVGSGILASLALVFRHRADPGYYGLGASGAIAGILFSFILLEPSVQLLVFFVPLPAWLFGLLYLV
ncbi:MAG: rhomboid family intramembrane serine protease, partial [Sphingobacteriia bacterium]